MWNKSTTSQFALTLLVLMAINLIGVSKSALPGENSALDSYLGHWQSDGEAFGQAAISTLSWTPALEGKFVQVQYTIKTGAPENNKIIFTGVAYYRQTGENLLEAFWADSTGDLHPITAILNGNTLESTWGVIGKKLGRTYYELNGTDQLTVTDWIMQNNEWRQFNQNTFSRVGPKEGEGMMEKVTGIGGVFFRAQDPGLVADWYYENLGIDLVPKDYDTRPWTQEAGPTVFSPFDQATEYFGKPGQQWMINFRVSDLDAMVAQLRKNGNEVEVDPETYPNGRFARVYDPEGTPIQLWQPAVGDQ